MSDVLNFYGSAEVAILCYDPRNDENFWLAVIVLCVVALLVVLIRALMRNLRATASI